MSQTKLNAWEMNRTQLSTRWLRPRRSHLRMARSELPAFDSMCEPPMGAHVLTPRRGYTHHGIYVGGGRVVHYRGLARGLRRGPVEEVSLGQFSQGRPIWISPRDTNGAHPEEIVRRARLRVGENRYRVFTNNCEHFCEWCICGDPRSYQVDALLARCRRIWQGLVVLLSHGGALARATTQVKQAASTRSA